MDLRTKKQKAIDMAAARIARHGNMTYPAIHEILEEEFKDVHEIQEDDGR